MIGARYGITAHVADRTLTVNPGDVLADLGPRLTGYEHTITATGGYESLTLSFTAKSLDEALTWMDRLLCPVTCYGPDTDEIWDGYIAAVEIRVGGRTRSISLDPVQNRVRARYTTVLGTPGATGQSSNTASQALYGVRDGVVSLGTTTQAAAEGLRNSWLARYALPRAAPQTEIRTGASGEAATVSLQCAGWYSSLGFVTLERADTATEAATAQVQTLLGSSSPGIAATNAFLATSATISATGVTTTRRIEADTTYRAAIEARLGLGSNSGQRLAWGVYSGRRLVVDTWAGATPNDIAYRVRLGKAGVESVAGSTVRPWQVRPDAMVEDTDFVVVGPPSEASDTAGRFYLERVAFRIDSGGWSLTLEPEASDDLTARIARLSN